MDQKAFRPFIQKQKREDKAVIKRSCPGSHSDVVLIKTAGSQTDRSFRQRITVFSPDSFAARNIVKLLPLQVFFKFEILDFTN